MTFDLPTIAILAGAALLYAALLPPRWRAWAPLVGSLVAVYWLQPPLPIRFSDYILPTLTILLTVAAWWLTRRPEAPAQKATLNEDRAALFLVVVVVLAMSLMRFVAADYRLTPSRPPPPWSVGLALGAVAAAGAGVARLAPGRDSQRLLTLLILSVLLLFVVIKTETLATGLSAWWRAQAGQDTSLASAADLRWLAFSYVAFRLIHTLRDRQTGILPVLSLRDYVSYVLFAPAYVAGPIDRAERFLTDVQALPQLKGLAAGRFVDGGSRIVVGLFKKFVIADSLAQGLSLNPINAVQADSAAALWLLLYCFSLRLYFDFGGYSDIAIGLGILFGIRLPENFDQPYLQSNINAFWQSWHMTLSNWVRFYVFSPLSRWLLKRRPRPSPTLIVLLTQVTTMVVIGLWHGISLNFFIWGLWHGLGLFGHKQWSDRTRPWYRRLQQRPRRVWSAASWFLTFQFVVLGWVWFALPNTREAVLTLARLFGFGW